MEKQPNILKNIDENNEQKKPVSVFELWQHVGQATAHKVGKIHAKSPDSMLAVYQNRITYTFIFGYEVASIHFDRLRSEIFFKGHNVRNMQLNDEQKQVLIDFKQVLANEEHGKLFLIDYCATLDRLNADNK